MTHALKRAKQMRAINDAFRREMPHGSVNISCEVAARFSNDQLREITELVRHCDAFGPDSDPDEWHETGFVVFEGIALRWQIEIWCECSRRCPSSLASQAVLRRVIEIGLAEVL